MKYEYRVVWKRSFEGAKEKRKIFQSLHGAERLMTILGPEPWKAWGKDPDSLICCSGSMCTCGGRTYREDSESTRADMPEIEYLRIEKREIGEWTP